MLPTLDEPILSGELPSMRDNFNSAEIPPLKIGRWADSSSAAFSQVPNCAVMAMHVFASQEGDSVGGDLFSFGAGEGMDYHKHEGKHKILVLRGKGYAGYYGVNYLIRAGDVYEIPEMAPHSIGAAEDEGLLVLSISDHYVPFTNPARMIAVVQKEITEPAPGGSPGADFGDRPGNISRANAGAQYAPQIH